MGEARGLKVKQFLFDKRALVVDGFCKRNGERTNYNKKESNEDSKLRVVVLPDFTLNAVLQYINRETFSQNDFIFTSGMRQPLRQKYLETVFHVH